MLGGAAGEARSAGDNVGPSHGAFCHLTSSATSLATPARAWCGHSSEHGGAVCPASRVGHPGPRPALWPVRRFTPGS